jgi:hypothetical protein
MAIDRAMVALRAWHPVRLTLVCVMLAMAGGTASTRGAYAEVSAATSVAGTVARQRTRRAERVPTPRAVAVAPSRLSTKIAVPADPQRVVAARYLTHCSLLL